MKRRLISFLLALCMVISILPVALATENTQNPFTDVDEGTWYYKYVQGAYEQGLMVGTSATTFSPNTTLSRAMVAQILYNKEGKPKTTAQDSFSDVAKTAWYYDAVQWAAKTGVTAGIGDGKFAPDIDVTREQFATMLYRGAGSPKVSGKLTSFPDRNAVSDWAKDAMFWAVSQSIIAGSKQDTGLYLLPTKSASRAEATAMIYRYVKVLDENIKKFTVSFHTDGGSKIEPQTIVKGEKATQPNDPTKDGFTFAGWFTDKELTKAYDFSVPVNRDIMLYAKWEESVPEITLNTGSDVILDGDLYYIFNDTAILSGTLSDAGTVKSVKCKAVVKNKELWNKNIAVSDNWELTEYTLYPGENQLIFTVETKNQTIIYKFTLMSGEAKNLDKIGVDENKDTDGDGIADYLEEAYGLNPQDRDTDKDGIPDGMEYQIVGCDATKYDTDNNNVSDGEEDADNDGLTNAVECALGTDPSTADSDADNLTDGEEVNQYGTDPLKDDTDGDGASDGWEIANGTNPLAAESTFSVSDDMQNGDTTVTVSLQAGGQQAENLRIEPQMDSLLFGEHIPGQIGNAITLSTDGEIDSAQVSFKIADDALENAPEDFTPTVYYMNEETQLLEEVPTTYGNGIATAELEHFSTYILLNKTEFDQIWSQEIKPPESESTTKSGLDVVFVQDYSRSMVDNDPNHLSTAVVNEFIEKLNSDTDRVGLVKFIANASVLSELTNDFSNVKALAQNITWDSGYNYNSGTNGSEGIYNAIQLLSDGIDSAKYIIFITDGEDNRNSYSYDELVERANQNNISIYSVGLGDADISVLTRIAESTNGKYYHATSATELPDIYTEVSLETVDYSTDTNQDGISDYYTKLLCDGTLTAGNGTRVFEGISYEEIQKNPDYDNDGLTNGEEIVVKTQGNRVYAYFKSDPTVQNTDGDMYSDFQEYKLGSERTVYNYYTYDIDTLINDEIYLSSMSSMRYDDEWVYRSSLGLGNFVYGGEYDWEYVSKKQLLDMIADYSKQMDVINENQYKKAAWLESAADVSDNAGKWIDIADTIIGAAGEAGDILNQLAQIRDNMQMATNNFNLARNLLKSVNLNDSDQLGLILDKLVKYENEMIQCQLDASRLSSKVGGNRILDKISVSTLNLEKMQSYAKTGGKIVLIGQIITTGFSTVNEMKSSIDVYSKAAAACRTYQEIDSWLKMIASDSGKSFVKNAAQQVRSEMNNQFKQFVGKLDTLKKDLIFSGADEIAINMVLGECGPIGWAVGAGRTLANLISNVGGYAAASLYEITSGDAGQYAARLLKQSVKQSEYQNLYAAGESSDKFFVLTGVTRINAEKKAIAAADNHRILWISLSKDVEQFCKDNISKVCGIGKKYGVVFVED